MSASGTNPLLAFTPDPAEFALEWLPDRDAVGGALRPFRLTSARFPDGDVRTYGLFALPPGSGPFPAILHIHGGGQTASPENLAYFTSRGYAAMSFDWTGITPQREAALVTSFPPSCPSPEDYLAQLGRQDIGVNRLYLAWRAARSCLALLRSLEGVDAARIGLHGISWGGFLTWLVNGTDSGIRCAVPVYGTGGLHWPGHIRSQIWAAMPAAARRTWLDCLEPRSYAQRQSGAVLHLNGSNDFFGGVDVLTELLPLLNCDWRLDLTPNTNHHVAATSSHLADAWFEHYLKDGTPLPPAPALRVEVETGGALRVLACGDRAHLTLWYSYGDAAHGDRCWCPANHWEPTLSGEHCLSLPAVGQTWLFVREFDPVRQTTQCSLPICLDAPTPARRPRQALSLYAPGAHDGLGNGGSTELYGGTNLEDDIDLTTDGLTARAAGGAINQIILRTPLRFGTSAASPRSVLELDLAGTESLRIDCLCGTTIQPDTYWRTLQPPAAGVVAITTAEFESVTTAGKPLTDFRRVRALVLSGQSRAGERLCIRRIRWVTVARDTVSAKDTTATPH